VLSKNFEVNFRISIITEKRAFLFMYEKSLDWIFKVCDVFGYGTRKGNHPQLWPLPVAWLLTFTLLLTTRGSVRGLGRQEKVSLRKVVISRSSWHAAIFRAKGQPHLEGFTVPKEWRSFFIRRQTSNKQRGKVWWTSLHTCKIKLNMRILPTQVKFTYYSLLLA
jgi:hypothetical protein